MTATASSRSGTIAGWTLFLASIAALGYGLADSGILEQPIWQPGGLRRFALLWAAYAVFSAAVFFIRPRALGPLLAGSALLCAIQAVGAVPVLAVIFLAASSIALGNRVL